MPGCWPGSWFPCGLTAGNFPDGWPIPGTAGLRLTAGKLPEFCIEAGGTAGASCSLVVPTGELAIIPGEDIIRTVNPQFMQEPLVVSH